MSSDTTIRRLLIILPLFLLLFTPAARAQDDDLPLEYLRYDVEITINQDGTFHVREILDVEFFEEGLTSGFADIPTTFTSGIANIAVSDQEAEYEGVFSFNGEPFTFAVDADADFFFVEWGYPETQIGERRTFVLEYDVAGGLWVYEEGDRLEWRAVPADRSGLPVRSSTVTVTLPEPIPADELFATAFGPEYEAEISDGEVIFTALQPLPDGLAFQILVEFPHGWLPTITPQPWQIAEDSAALEYTLDDVSVELAVQEDGLVAVSETQRVSVLAGAMYSGNRYFYLDAMDGLTGWQVAEGDISFSQIDPATQDGGVGCDDCFEVISTPGSADWVRVDQETGQLTVNQEQAGRVDLNWYFPALVSGESTAFTLDYTASGALQILGEETDSPGAQRLRWTAIPGYDVPVSAATAVVALPPDVTWEEAQISGGQLVRLPDGRTQVTHDGPVPAGEAWVVELTLPANATAAVTPNWQLDLAAGVTEAAAVMEAQRQEEVRIARQQLGFGVGGCFLLLLGLAGVLLAWYWRGRDPGSEGLTMVTPEYLSEPPSALPPGVVAYLLDEEATTRGVLASLFHLATLGLLRIDFGGELRLARNWSEEVAPGQTVETPDGDEHVIAGHQAALFNALRGSITGDPGETTGLTRVMGDLQKVLPQLYQEMGAEAGKFFAELPSVARRRWLVIGQWLVLAGIGATVCLGFLYLGRLGAVSLAPTVALILIGLALILVSRWMARRSDIGAGEAARWRAFRTYLEELKRYGDEESAQRALDEYFPFAVAFGIEEVVLRQSREMGGRPPYWTRPIIVMPHHRPRPDQVGPAGAPLRPLVARPAPSEAGGLPDTLESTGPGGLEGLSRDLTGSLEAANRGLTRVLSAAVGEADDTPFEMVFEGAKTATKFSWKAGTSTAKVLGDILEASASGGGGGGYSGSRSGGFSSRSSGRSSSRSSGRSSSSRRSGGGGRRGFR